MECVVWHYCKVVGDAASVNACCIDCSWTSYASLLPSYFQTPVLHTLHTHRHSIIPPRPPTPGLTGHTQHRLPVNDPLHYHHLTASSPPVVCGLLLCVPAAAGVPGVRAAPARTCCGGDDQQERSAARWVGGSVCLFEGVGASTCGRGGVGSQPCCVCIGQQVLDVAAVVCENRRC